MNILEILNEEVPETIELNKEYDIKIVSFKIHKENILELLIQRSASIISNAIDKYISSKESNRVPISASTIVKTSLILTEAETVKELNKKMYSLIGQMAVVIFREKTEGYTPTEMRSFKNKFLADIRRGNGPNAKELIDKFLKDTEAEKMLADAYNSIQSNINSFVGDWFEDVVLGQLKNKEREPVKGLYELMVSILGEDYFSDSIQINKSLNEKAAFDIEISFSRKAVITISCKFRPSETERKQITDKEGKPRGYSLGNQRRVQFSSKDIDRVKDSINELGLSPEKYIDQRMKKVANQKRSTKVYYTDVYKIIEDALDKGEENVLSNIEEALYLMRAGGRWMVTAKLFKRGEAKVKTLRHDKIRKVQKSEGNILFKDSKGDIIIKLRPKGEAEIF